MKRISSHLLLSMGLIAACGDGEYRPTAPYVPAPAPPAPEPQPSVSSFGINFWAERDWVANVEEVKVFLDGTLICQGHLHGYYAWGGECNYGEFEELDVGRHELLVRISRQVDSPTTYAFYNNVEIVHQIDGVAVDSQRFTWEGWTTLETGQAWRRDFEIRQWPD